MTTITYRSRLTDQEISTSILPETSSLQRITKFFNEWVQFSSEAWIKASRPHCY